MYIDYLKKNPEKALKKYSVPEYYNLKISLQSDESGRPSTIPELEDLENKRKQLSAEYTKLNKSKPPIDYNRKAFLQSELQIINTRILILKDILGIGKNAVAKKNETQQKSSSDKIKFSIAFRHTPPNFDVSKDAFVKQIYKYCDAKKISEVQLYKDAQLSRQVFSKIRVMATNDYNPSKPTVINICLALKLNLCETQELLALTGYTLSSAILSDKIIAWCIEHNEFNVLEVAELLYDLTGEAVLVSQK